MSSRMLDREATMRRKAGVFAAILLSAACTEPAERVRLTAPDALLNVSGGEAKRYVIVFNQPKGLPSNVERIVAGAGGTITARVEEIGAVGATSSDPEFAAKAAANSQVKAVSEDIEVQMIPSAASVENALVNAQEPGSQGPAEPPGPDPQPGTEPLYNQQWDKMRVNASATGSYAVQQGRRDVVVGILDTGVEVLPFAHPDIAPNLDFARSRSFAVPVGMPPGPPEGDPDPARWDDRNGHGSWCASAVASPINAFGISGVAPGVTLVALKVLRDNGVGSFFWVAQALVYAGVNKFDVASMSLGGYIPHAGGQALITVVQRAVEFARSNGVTPIAALGNDNFDLSDGDFVRSFIFAPAEMPGVIGVSSTGYTNRKAFYSNYGVGQTDVSAPGGGSTTFDPMPPHYIGNGRVLGAYSAEGIGTIAPVFREEECTPGPGGPCFYYAWIRGTSMATPNAAGVAALIISQYGDFTPDNSQKLHMSPTRVEAILQQTANNQPCTDNIFAPPFDVFNANCKGEAGGYTNFFGKGIVDALKAVTQ
jgi:subtilisin family serine protease